MHLLNETPFAAAVMPGPTPTGGGLTMVVKGTFALEHDGQTARTSVVKGALLSAERAWDEPTMPGCKYPSDLVPYKPCADVLVLGTVGPSTHTGNARVQVRIGTLTKIVELKGHAVGRRVASLTPLAAPNAQRLATSGTYDEAWLTQRWPWFPKDFDWSLFNAAPADQRVDGYLRGDETLIVDGFSNERHRTVLPALRPRGFLRRPGSEAIEEIPLALDTLWLDLDTNRLVLVWRGVLEGTLHERTRALVAVEPLAEAPRPANEYHPEARWTRNRAAASEGQRDHDSVPDETPRAAARESERTSSAAQTSEAESVGECLALLREGKVPPEVLARAEHATSLAALIAILDAEVQAPAALTPEYASELETAKQALKDLGLDASLLDDLDPKPPATVAVPEGSQDAPLTREFVVRHVAAGESLAGADLRGLDLSHLNLSHALLAGACLDGADLTATKLNHAELTFASLKRARADGASFDDVTAENADFDGLSARAASFARANLASARMPNTTLIAACFDGAELSGALLTGANLEHASLRDVDSNKAELQLAVLRGANATGANFRAADFTGADLTGAVLDRVNLTLAALTHAKLEGVSAIEARFEGARGDAVSFVGANLSRVRAGNGCAFPDADFRDSKGDGANWSEAALERSRFDGASLCRALFRGAVLEGASFHLAKLERADFSHANLARAKLTKANAYQCRFPGADLTLADCRASNFFECEFWQATTSGSRFEGSILKQTKLDPEKTK